MIGAVVVRNTTHRSASSVPATSPDTPTRAEFRTAMDALVARSCGVYLIYSGGITEYHNYSRQLRDAFRGAAFLPHVRYEYCPDMDHTITATASQRQFVSKVEKWALEIGAATGR
jgi:hypothetical protein